ncbi:hypothetical protein ACFPOG_05715 [Paenibacillus aestuarii]|uniref:Uncharacterized protein n=1 Tax=Paenibacillus aestuarii TaxID=516965 RepID=A0ABW0K4H3_9BACL
MGVLVTAERKICSASRLGGRLLRCSPENPDYSMLVSTASAL